MTEELKKALESAKTEEEKKAVAERFKEEIQKLTPEELDKIAGGVYWNHFYKPDSATSDETKKAGPWW